MFHQGSRETATIAGVFAIVDGGGGGVATVDVEYSTYVESTCTPRWSATVDRDPPWLITMSYE